jgi:cold shock protein
MRLGLIAECARAGRRPINPPPGPHRPGNKTNKGILNAQIYGELKTWNLGRAFGFFKRDDGQPDVFVHVSAFQDVEPFEGTRYSFDVVPGRGGKSQAVNVRRA